jgi:hypothetical protein
MQFVDAMQLLGIAPPRQIQRPSYSAAPDETFEAAMVLTTR